jgi:hypothetical protein
MSLHPGVGNGLSGVKTLMAWGYKTGKKVTALLAQKNMEGKNM